MSIVAQAYYRDLEGEIDSLLVVSGVKGRNRRDDELAGWLRQIVPVPIELERSASRRLLARAGVLTDQRATVHWKYAHELAHRYRPSGRSQPDLGSGRQDLHLQWVSAGIDLALAWVAEDCGSGIATAAARELAHRVSMSVRNFCRVFAGDVGTTPARYVLHLRVEAARRLLHSSPHDLGRVARAAGFGSVESMRQAFVQVLGKSPREMCAAPERNGAS